MLAAPAFTVAGLVPSGAEVTAPRSLRASAIPESVSSSGVGSVGGLAAAGFGAVALGALLGRAGTRRGASGSKPAKFVGLSSSAATSQQSPFVRDQLVACRAQLSDSVEDMDRHIEEIEAVAKKMLAGVAAAGMVFTSCADGAMAYPVFAQQNYPNPREPTGKLACANCHLAGKEIDVRMPAEVLPDTIFRTTVEVPLKYKKRLQPIADGSKASLNIGAIAILPEGWKLAPKDRLPKSLKKEMKGLSWSAYSKEKPYILVAGPVPGEMYEKMILPILAPDPAKDDKVEFGKETFYFGGNRGRGQVYPEGNKSNNNQFFAEADGTIKAIDGLKVTIQKKDGTTLEQTVLPGADLVVTVGEEVRKDEPITTNPNVGGFGQAEKEVILQDMNRVYAFCALSFSIFLSQLSFVLKKKQFEKVQLAEGF